MNAVPIIDYDPSFFDIATHQLSGPQILYYLFNAWQTQDSVILWCRKGDGASKINTIRVALSKERKSRGVMRTFELRFNDPWPYTYNGVKGEAFKVEKIRGSFSTQFSDAMMRAGMKL